MDHSGDGNVGSAAASGDSQARSAARSAAASGDSQVRPTAASGAVEPLRVAALEVRFADDFLDDSQPGLLDHDIAPAERVAVAFGRLLRAAGLAVPLDTLLAFAQALDAVGLGSRDAVYWAGRATLVRKPEDRTLYDRAFHVFWEGRRATVSFAPEPEPARVTLAVDEDRADNDDSGDAQPSDDPTIMLRFSATEVLRQKDFAAYDDDELAQAHQMMARLRLAGSLRACRRTVASKKNRGRPDLRRTVRAALRAGGEPMERAFLRPALRPRRLVLLLDVSGSMEPYARALLRFVHAAVVGRQKVEAFALGTQLTRITRELSSRDPDRALEKAAATVTDWSGGTRLGDGLRRFNDEWGVRGMARGATVVIMSDGWDRGDPEVMAEQMARLHRVTHQIVWVNPLKVTPGYAPLARGMAAALAHIDAFVEGHSIEAMERLMTVISDQPSRGSQSLTTAGMMAS